MDNMKNNDYELNYYPNNDIALFISQKTMESFKENVINEYKGRSYKNEKGNIYKWT
jgi:hypothetical protein